MDSSYEEEDMEILMLMIVLRQRRLRREQKTTSKVWVRKMLRAREGKGAYHNLIREMGTSDREAHFNFFRMSPERFDHLLNLLLDNGTGQRHTLSGISPALKPTANDHRLSLIHIILKSRTVLVQ